MKEFKAIKNMVIREAENVRLGVMTFEDDQMVNGDWEDEEWFRRSAETGLGKLLQSEDCIKKAVKWYEKASAQRKENRSAKAAANRC